MITAAVRERVAELAETGGLPAHLIDLEALSAHLAEIRTALPPEVELYYAAKANSAPPVLTTLAEHVDGFEVASGGELAHLRRICPEHPIAFGGPGKTEAELAAVLDGGVGVLHVEGLHELRLVAAAAEQLGTDLDVLLRVNPPISVHSPTSVQQPNAAGATAGPALVMGGRSAPFGLDPEQADQCLEVLRGSPRLHLRGVHAHLASGLDANRHLELSAAVLDWATGWADRHQVKLEVVTLGGGMAVDYAEPADRFDWLRFGAGLRQLALQYPGIRLRIEPGRALSAYAGWYAAAVLDVRSSHGSWFAVLDGGTHHLRTPAARGHDQPFVVVPTEGWAHPWQRPQIAAGTVTIVGSLCTPRDVLARDQPVARLRAGDVVVFALAGAYGWNISHHEFLMHPPPTFHYLGRPGP